MKLNFKFFPFCGSFTLQGFYILQVFSFKMLKGIFVDVNSAIIVNLATWKPGNVFNGNFPSGKKICNRFADEHDQS